MHIRKDGKEARQKILDAACQVFGEDGYHEAMYSEICLRAGVGAVGEAIRQREAPG